MFQVQDPKKLRSVGTTEPRNVPCAKALLQIKTHAYMITEANDDSVVCINCYDPQSTSCDITLNKGE